MARSIFNGSFIKAVVSLSKLRTVLTQEDLEATLTHEDLRATLLHKDVRAIALFGPPSPFVRPNETLSVLDSLASVIGKSILDESLGMSDVCVTILTPKITGSVFNAALINNFMLNE
jgi:hypothetical protein